MKKLLSAILVLWFATMHCLEANGEIIPENGPKNEIFKQDDKYGLRSVDTKKVTLPAIYDTIETGYFDFDILSDRGLYEQYYKISKDGKIGIFSDALSKVLLPVGPYKNFGRHGYRSEVPYVKVFTESGDDFILSDCGVKITFDVIETLVEDVAYTFDPDHAVFTPKLYKGFIIRKDGKYGYMNKNGKTVILPKYDEWLSSDKSYGIRRNYTKLVFKNYNSAHTGFTLYAYALNGTLLASKFFNNDQKLAVRRFLERYF